MNKNISFGTKAEKRELIEAVRWYNQTRDPRLPNLTVGRATPSVVRLYRLVMKNM